MKINFFFCAATVFILSQDVVVSLKGISSLAVPPAERRAIIAVNINVILFIGLPSLYFDLSH